MKKQLCARNGLGIGVIGIALVILAQAFNSFACYKHDFGKFLEALGFVAFPMLPGIVALFTKSPYRAFGASVLFLPWLLFAYHTDCGSTNQGGGASMVYVAVVLWGFPCALIGALFTPKINCNTPQSSKNAA